MTTAHSSTGRKVRAVDTLAVGSLIRLRWLAVVGQLTTVLVSWYWLGVSIHWKPVLAVIAVTAATNVMLVSLRHAGFWRGSASLPHVIAWDMVLLAFLFYWTGGAGNPFSLFLLLHVVMAALTLPWRSSTLLLLVAMLSLAFLSEYRVELLMRDGTSLPASLYTLGKYISFILVGGALVYFVQHLRYDLRLEMRQRREAQSQVESEKRHHAVATLAAGAAHEMGTPLSTIALLGRELELSLSKQKVDPEWVEMTEGIRDEVERCRLILSRLNPELAHVPATELTLDEVREELLRTMSHAERVRFKWDGAVKVSAPLEILREALANLIKNALLAAPAPAVVDVRMVREGDFCHFTVRDRGSGMSDSQRQHLGEPFQTTRAPGEGMGLGLYLVKLLAKQMGGSLWAEAASDGEGGEIFHLTLRLNT